MGTYEPVDGVCVDKTDCQHQAEDKSKAEKSIHEICIDKTDCQQEQEKKKE